MLNYLQCSVVSLP